MKIICEYPVGTLRVGTAVNNISVIAKSVKSVPGVGKPFLVFASLPPGTVAEADLNMFPEYVASSVEADNAAIIQQMLDNPPLAALTIVP